MRGYTFLRRLLYLVTTFILLSSSIIVFAVPDEKSDKATGVGLAGHAIEYWSDDVQYVWGGTTKDGCDCSGLIVSYNGIGGNRVDLLGSAKCANLDWGSDMQKIPRVHGLGLKADGHVGIYLGSSVSLSRSRQAGNRETSTGNAIDQRSEADDCVLHKAENRSGWYAWFKIVGVSYPKTGWVKFNGSSFYYENGQYVVNTTKKIKGVTYKFNANGESDKHPAESEYQATDYTKTTVSSGSGTVSDTSTIESGTSNREYSRGDSPFKDGRELTYEEQKRVDDIVDELNNESETSRWGNLFSFVALAGLCLIVYSIVLLLAFYIDILNTVSDFSIISMLSFGRLHAVSSKAEQKTMKTADDSGTRKYISHKDIWLIFAVGIMSATLLLNGRVVYLWIVRLFNWVMSIFT